MRYYWALVVVLRVWVFDCFLGKLFCFCLYVCRHHLMHPSSNCIKTRPELSLTRLCISWQFWQWTSDGTLPKGWSFLFRSSTVCYTSIEWWPPIQARTQVLLCKTILPPFHFCSRWAKHIAAWLVPTIATPNPLPPITSHLLQPNSSPVQTPCPSPRHGLCKCCKQQHIMIQSP